jgi:hypothetical protein
MKRGRPAFDPRVAVCLWVLIEAHREPIRADRSRTSIRQACERLRTELKDLCEVGISMERLRTVHRTITNRLETDSDMRRYAIEKLASITVWRRKLIADGLGAYRRQIIPLL